MSHLNFAELSELVAKPIHLYLNGTTIESHSTNLLGIVEKYIKPYEHISEGYYTLERHSAGTQQYVGVLRAVVEPSESFPDGALIISNTPAQRQNREIKHHLVYIAANCIDEYQPLAPAPKKSLQFIHALD